MNDEKDIDISRLVRAALSHWLLILLTAVICGAAAFAYSKFFVTPLYRSTVSIFISNSDEMNIDSVDPGDVEASNALVSVYSYLVRTNMVLDKVAESTELTQNGISYSAAALSGMISTSQKENASIMYVTVTNPNPIHCAVIANAVAETGIKEITNVSPGSSARTLDDAEVPKYPFYPSKTKNTVLWFIIGGGAMLVFVVVRELLDTKLKSTEDFGKIISAPVLGEICKMNTATK